MRTVVGLYDAHADARESTEALVDAGFPRDRISMATQHNKRRVATGERRREADDQAARRASAGGTEEVVLGGLGGLLIGLGTVAIPGLGVIAAAGPLAGLITGGVSDGLVGALIELAIPKEEAEIYTEGVRHGATLILVQSEESRVNEARSLMSHSNPIDIDKRTKDWREGGRQGDDRDAEPEDEQQTRQEQETAGDERDKVATDVRGDRRRIRVHTYEVSRPVEEKVQLHHEHIDVERVALDRDIVKEDLAFDVNEEEVIELLETQEEVVVEKHPRVVGHVRLIQKIDAETEIVRESARRREVDFDRIESERDVVVAHDSERRDAKPDSDADYEEYETEFRRHYQSSLAENGHAFSFYRPAYVYGCRLARREQGRNRAWSDIETEARRRWLEANPDTSWMEVDSAVHESYRRCQSSSA
jgi:hypothetical protein